MQTRDKVCFCGLKKVSTAGTGLSNRTNEITSACGTSIMGTSGSSVVGGPSLGYCSGGVLPEPCERVS